MNLPVAVMARPRTKWFASIPLAHTRQQVVQPLVVRLRDGERDLGVFLLSIFIGPVVGNKTLVLRSTPELSAEANYEVKFTWRSFHRQPLYQCRLVHVVSCLAYDPPVRERLSQRPLHHQ